MKPIDDLISFSKSFISGETSEPDYRAELKTKLNMLKSHELIELAYRIISMEKS
jgi:hypothetical protein